MTRFVGLDIHKETATAVFIDATGRRLKTVKVACDEVAIREFREQQLGAEDRVALEATTNTWAWVRLLCGSVAEIAVANPLKVKAIAEAKLKTDKVDAETLAQLLRVNFLPRVWVPDAATEQQRRLCSLRESLVRHRTRLKNRLRSVLAQALVHPPMAELFGVHGRQWLETLEVLSAADRFEVSQLLELLDAVEKQHSQVAEALGKLAYGDERAKLLMTFPGLDFAGAMALLSAIGDIERFASGGKLASYLGLVPRVKQSASKHWTGPITKAGRSHARWMVVEAAQHLALAATPLASLYQRLRRKKNHGVAVIAVARKLVTIAWRMLKNNEPYRYALPSTTQVKLAKLRVLATGRRLPRGRAAAGKASPVVNRGTGSSLGRSLAQVYAIEGLPALQPPPRGEKRVAARAPTKGRFQETASRTGSKPQCTKAGNAKEAPIEEKL